MLCKTQFTRFEGYHDRQIYAYLTHRLVVDEKAGIAEQVIFAVLDTGKKYFVIRNKINVEYRNRVINR